MKTTLLAAAAAMACGGLAIAQTDPNKPWFRWLLDPDRTLATTNPNSVVKISPDGSTVFFQGEYLYPPFTDSKGLIRQTTPDGPMEFIPVFEGSSCSHAFRPIAATNGASRLTGQRRGIGLGDTQWFEWSPASGLVFYELTDHAPIAVSPTGHSVLYRTDNGGIAGQVYTQETAGAALVTLDLPSFAESMSAFLIAPHGDTVAGIVGAYRGDVWTNRLGLWRDGAYVGPLDHFPESDWVQAIAVSDDGEAVLGFFEDRDSNSGVITVRLVTWNEHSGYAMHPLSFPGPGATPLGASSDFSVVYFPVSDSTLALAHRMRLWREGAGAQDIEKVFKDEYGFEFGDANVYPTSLSLDGKTIAGFVVPLEASSTSCGARSLPFVAHLPDPIPGDLTKDWEVTGADLAVFLAAWGSNDPDADFDDDGLVASGDLALLLASWGR